MVDPWNMTHSIKTPHLEVIRGALTDRAKQKDTDKRNPE